MPREAVVHLIDDDEGVRHSLAFLLATSGLAVRVHDSATAFLAALPGVQPGCIVTDVRMPGVDGMDLQRRLKDLGVNLPVIVMTGHGDIALAVQAMKAGAIDFIEKPFDEQVMLSAIHTALDRYGETGLRDTEIAGIRRRLALLSPRERDVVQGLLEGHPNKTIAYDLNISPRTVEVHRANAMSKMGASSLSSLVRMGLLAGVLPGT
jgi:two-component system response regulator FixJ